MVVGSTAFIGFRALRVDSGLQRCKGFAWLGLTEPAKGRFWPALAVAAPLSRNTHAIRCWDRAQERMDRGSWAFGPRAHGLKVLGSMA